MSFLSFSYSVSTSPSNITRGVINSVVALLDSPAFKSSFRSVALYAKDVCGESRKLLIYRRKLIREIGRQRDMEKV